MTLALDRSRAYNVGSCIETAYRLFTPGVLAPATAATPPPAGWRVLSELTAIDRVACKSEREFFGLALQSDTDSEVLFAIRGTDTFLERLVDAEFVRCAFPGAQGAANVEDGFCSVYSSLRCSTTESTAMSLVEQLEPGTRVTIAGHSLGAAVATLLAADLAVHATSMGLTLFTCASPRVGDSAFSAFATLVSQRITASSTVDSRQYSATRVSPASRCCALSLHLASRRGCCCGGTHWRCRPAAQSQCKPITRRRNCWTRMS